jgi:glycerol-3-phosphate dehydrogenase (NAD(P)+)
LNPKYKITVLGAGSWAIALALVLEYNGHDVTLWEFRPDAAERLNQTRDAKEFLPGIKIPVSIQVKDDLEQACTDKNILIVAVPSHVVRSVGERLNKLAFEDLPILVNVAKGIENVMPRKSVGRFQPLLFRPV